MGAGRRIVRRAEAPQHRRDEVAHVQLGETSSARGRETATVARGPLLQQQLRRLDGRLGMEARAHGAAVSTLSRATSVMPW